MMEKLANRRHFLAGAAGLLSCRSRPRRRPNILLAISDDQSWLHTSAFGDRVVKTPAFDRIARSGVLFAHAFSVAPSCTPSRGSLLTGQHMWRLEGGANLFNTLDKKFAVYPELLQQAGYFTGFMRKGWGPGNHEIGGRTQNPAGPRFDSFEQFHRSVPKDRPFCFWFGSNDSHRPYAKGTGESSGLKADDVQVPPWLPDVLETRKDILDYYFEIQRFDRELGAMLDLLEKSGELENTLVIVTSDNGMPFPRAKATLYDSGTRMPLAISWSARVQGGRVIDDFVSHPDLAPTILEAAGLEPHSEMTGRSLLQTLESGRQGLVDTSRTAVYAAMERHAFCRPGGLGYPMRAIRTREYLYIHNFEPDRMPAGESSGYGYGEIDDSPTKSFVLDTRNSSKFGHFFRLACEKRPAEEMYEIGSDPGQLNNVAGKSEFTQRRDELRSRLFDYLKLTRDPRVAGGAVTWDTLPFYGRKRI